MSSDIPKPCSFPRFFINRLPAVFLTAAVGFAFVRFIFWLFNLMGVEKVISDPDFAGTGLVCLVIGGFCAFKDRIFLLVAQPSNPYKFSSEFIYFLNMPTDFKLKSDDLPPYWKLKSMEEGQIHFELRTPIDDVSRLNGEARDTEGLSLFLTFVRPKDVHGIWHAVAVRPWEGRSCGMLPDRFIVRWFSPTILGELEKFFVHQGLIDFLIDEKGRKMDFTWNSYVLHDPVD